jgi:hypothetical protein
VALSIINDNIGNSIGVTGIDIESHKNRLFKFCYVPATSAAHKRLLFFFLLLPFTVLMKQTRQAVHAIKQSIFFDVYGYRASLHNSNDFARL